MDTFKQWAWVLIIASQVIGCVDYIDPDEPDPFMRPRTYGRYTPPAKVPDIQAPSSLSFDGRDDELRTRTLSVSNVGRGPLSVESISLEVGRAYEVEPVVLPLVIEPGEQASLQITLEPSQSASGDEDVLVILSDDPDEPRVEVKLEASASVEQPCILIEPAVVDFGVVPLGAQASAELQVRNCSPDEPLTFKILRGTGPLPPGPIPVDLTGRVDEFITLEPGDAPEVFEAFYVPRVPGELKREYAVEVRGARQQTLTLVGRAVEPPPRCVDTQIAVGGSAVQGRVVARPLDSIELSGALSTSSEGVEVERYEWTLVSSPADSTSGLEARGDQRALYLDLAGEYVVELKAWDAQGNPSCAPKRVSIQAVPNEYVHVQLVWDTPGDADQTDNIGADVDIHLARAQDPWNSTTSCNWQSLSPDWGVAFDPLDDPSLDIDDIDGSGPENINLNVVDPNATYRIGVHSFDAAGFGSSDVTVRLYIGGQLVQELGRVRLRDQQFLHAMDLTFTDGLPSVTVPNRVYDTFP